MRGLISAAVVAVAVILQLAVADRIAFPGGAGPDLVLLTVAALALATGPMAGAVTGFCAGLALDVAPPAGHLVGQDALVFCLVGYACGLIATRPGSDGVPEREHSALFEIGVTAAGAACGEGMAAALGVMFSDPRVTWPAIKHVLPVAIGYDLLLSPFVLFAAAAMLRLAGAITPRGDSLDRAGKSRSGLSRSGLSRAGLGRAGPGAVARRAAWTAAPQSGSVRQMTGVNSPRLRLSGQGSWFNGAHGGPGRTGTNGPGTNGPGTGRAGLGGREPRLKLGHGRSMAGGTARPAFTPSAPRRTSSGLASSKLARSRLGASLLGGSVFSRPAAGFGRSSFLSGGSGGAGGSAGNAGKTHLGSAAHQPRFRKASVLGRLAQGLRPGRRGPAVKSPGKRWLRGGTSPGRGSLGNGGLPRSGPPRSGPPRSGLARVGLARVGLGKLGRGRSGLGKGGLSKSGLGSGGLGSGGMGKSGLGGRAPGRGWLRGSAGRGKSRGFGTARGLSPARPRFGSGRKGPARLRMRPKKLNKSWRRTGGYR
jgi:rod shape-determining protein MreD